MGFRFDFQPLSAGLVNRHGIGKKDIDLRDWLSKADWGRWHCITFLVLGSPWLIQAPVVASALALLLPLAFLLNELEFRVPRLFDATCFVLSLFSFLDIICDCVMLFPGGILDLPYVDRRSFEGTADVLALMRVLFMLGISFFLLLFCSLVPEGEGGKSSDTGIMLAFYKLLILLAACFQSISGLLNTVSSQSQPTEKPGCFISISKANFFWIFLLVDLAFSGFSVGVLTAIELGTGVAFDREWPLYSEFCVLKLIAWSVSMIKASHTLFYVMRPFSWVPRLDITFRFELPESNSLNPVTPDDSTPGLPHPGSDCAAV